MRHNNPNLDRENPKEGKKKNRIESRIETDSDGWRAGLPSVRRTRTGYASGAASHPKNSSNK
jgi:hypothetical protein